VLSKRGVCVFRVWISQRNFSAVRRRSLESMYLAASSALNSYRHPPDFHPIFLLSLIPASSARCAVHVSPQHAPFVLDANLPSTFHPFQGDCRIPQTAIPNAGWDILQRYSDYAVSAVRYFV
jgi:hypothetical protein